MVIHRRRDGVAPHGVRKQTWDVHVTGPEGHGGGHLAGQAAGLVSTSGTIAVSTESDAMATSPTRHQAIISAWPYYRSKLCAERWRSTRWPRSSA